MIDKPTFPPNGPTRADTRIVTVPEADYDVVFFASADGGGEAVITRRGDKPTVVNIAPPVRGRRIVIERKAGTLEILYKDVS